MFAGLLNGLRKPCHGSWNWKFKLSNNPKIGNFLESTLLFSILCHPFVLGLSSPLWLFSTLLVSFSSFILIYDDFECGNSWNNLNTGTKKEQYLARGSHVFSLCLLFFMNSWNKYETYSTRRKKKSSHKLLRVPDRRCSWRGRNLQLSKGAADFSNLSFWKEHSAMK